MDKLPVVILSDVFQSLDGRDSAAAGKVCRQWQKALESDGYWAMRGARDGIGQLKPLESVRHKSFYRSFHLLGKGEVDWLVWYDDAMAQWVVNEELLASLEGVAVKAATAVISVCPASACTECISQAASLLSSMMRSKDAFNIDECLTPIHRKGIQVWTNPSVFGDGTTALYMLAQGIGKARDSGAVDEVTQQLQVLVYSLSSMVFAIDDEHASGIRWWDSLLPNTVPRPVTLGPLAAAKGTRLYVVSSEDLSIPTHISVPPGDRERVSRWVSHFEELCILKSSYPSPNWHVSIAEDCLQVGTADFGRRAAVYHPGTIWPSLAIMKPCVGLVGEIATLVVERLNDQPHALYTDEFDEHVGRQICESRVQSVAAFYKKAMAIELESGPILAAELAHHGQAAEAPAEVTAPLGSTQLIEVHEQHFFSACRRLIFLMSESGVDVDLSIRSFESLKNKISDEFRTVWCINQGRSKAFCEATFDSVFEGIRAKYVCEAGTDDGEDAASVSSRSQASSHPSRDSQTSHDRAPRKKKADHPAEESKTDVKLLKRFYQSFIDHLDEYEMKAIGTRTSDVMLGKTQDLLERIEASKGHGFRSGDLELATNQLCQDVTARVVKEVAHMERSRGEMQKTCALYTKLLGMQCRNRIAAARRDSWAAMSTSLINSNAARVQMYRAVMGGESAEETHRETTTAEIDRLIASLTALERTTSVEITQFSSSLPDHEKNRSHRFGIVAKTETSAFSTNLFKAKALFSRVKKRLAK